MTGICPAQWCQFDQRHCSYIFQCSIFSLDIFSWSLFHKYRCWHHESVSMTVSSWRFDKHLNVFDIQLRHLRSFRLAKSFSSPWTLQKLSQWLCSLAVYMSSGSIKGGLKSVWPNCIKPAMCEPSSPFPSSRKSVSLVITDVRHRHAQLLLKWLTINSSWCLVAS